MYTCVIFSKSHKGDPIIMKKIEKFIKTACTYTVLMLVALYLFALVMKLTSNGINFGKFALVVAFGAVLAAAEYIYKLESIGKIWQTVLHYCILLFSFTVIFTWSGMLGKESDMFASFFVFTFLYFLVFGAFALVKYLTKIGNKKGKADFPASAKAKSSYKPRFDNSDD